MSLSRFWPESNRLDALIAAAQGGSSEALGTLLEQCRDYLLLVAGRELGRDLQGKIGASDLVQETFVRAQEVFGSFHGPPRRSCWLAAEGAAQPVADRAAALQRDLEARHFAGNIVDRRQFLAGSRRESAGQRRFSSELPDG